MHRICQIIHFHYTLDATYTQSVLVSGSLFVIYGVWYRCGDDAMACGCICLFSSPFLFCVFQKPTLRFARISNSSWRRSEDPRRVKSLFLGRTICVPRRSLLLAHIKRCLRSGPLIYMFYRAYILVYGVVFPL